MARTHHRLPIVNTPDEELSVLSGVDDSGCVRVFVRIGEEGVTYRASQTTTFLLERKDAFRMIEQLQRELRRTTGVIDVE